MRTLLLSGCLCLGAVSPRAEPKFRLTGDAASARGATWSYSDSHHDLRGVVLKPKGDGPFPVVLLNHGTGDDALNYGRLVGRVMTGWGYAVIAPHYTHASGVPCGKPGACGAGPDWGASEANVRRGLKTVELLERFAWADTANVFVFGHSRGAFVLTALVAAAPDRFRAAAHTAGGVAPEGLVVDVPGVLPRDGLAHAIRAPYLLHHGDADRTVPLAMDERLDSLLKAGGIEHRLHVYRGYHHNTVALDARMFARTREWFDDRRAPAPKRP